MKVFTSALVLHNPDFDLPFFIQMDASKMGLGTILSQVFEGKEHPVLYVSRNPTPSEQHYTTNERETLAIKWVIKELKYHLFG